MSDNLYRSDKDLPLLISFISFRFSLSNSAAFAVAQAQRHTGFCDISNSHSLQFFMHQRKFDSTHKLFLFLSLFLLFLSFKWFSINNSIFLLHKMLQDCHFNKISSYKSFPSFYTKTIDFLYAK